MNFHIEGLQFLAGQAVFALVLLAFVLGASIGSFLNVVIYRFPLMLNRQWLSEAQAFLDIKPDDERAEHKTFNLAFPASACPVCSAKITAWQNIPILSYLLLRGKCHSCKTPISSRYPIVEFLTGLLTVILLVQFGPGLQLGAMLVLTYISIALFGIDVDQQLLPDDLTLPLVWLGLLVNSFAVFTSLQSALWGAVLGYGVLWLVFWVFKLCTGKEGMGYGDFKLLAAYGAWFGWPILPNVVLLSSLLGSVVGVWLIVRKKQNAQTPIAFGPFIIVAGWLTAVYPAQFTLINYIR